MDTKINKLEEVDKTNNPFKVPENYFAQFNEEIMNRLPEKEVIVPEPVSLWGRAKLWVYLAAMFAGSYFIINFLKQAPESENLEGNQLTTQQIRSASTSNTENYWSTVQVSEEEFYQYLEEQLIDDNYFDFIYHHYYLN